MRNTVTMHLRLGAKIPMGVTFYDIAYKTGPVPMGFFLVGSQPGSKKNPSWEPNSPLILCPLIREYFYHF